VQGVGVGAALARELLHGSRPVGQRLCDPQIRDERERSGDEHAAQRVPENRLRSGSAHATSSATGGAIAGVAAIGGAVTCARSPRSRYQGRRLIHAGAVLP
jgi:hypothetical protein